MDETLLGKCGYYCGQCPSFIAGECTGCIKGNNDGVCYARDCVLEKGILTEYKILSCFIKNANKPVYLEELARFVWGVNYEAVQKDLDSLRSNISRLRAKACLSKGIHQ